LYFKDKEEDNENRPMSPTFVQEQEAIKESFKKAVKDEADSSDDDLFVPKRKTQEEQVNLNFYIFCILTCFLH
jgi:hypothetical protein